MNAADQLPPVFSGSGPACSSGPASSLRAAGAPGDGPFDGLFDGLFDGPPDVPFGAPIEAPFGVVSSAPHPATTVPPPKRAVWLPSGEAISTMSSLPSSHPGPRR